MHVGGGPWVVDARFTASSFTALSLAAVFSAAIGVAPRDGLVFGVVTVVAPVALAKIVLAKIVLVKIVPAKIVLVKIGAGMMVSIGRHGAPLGWLNV